MKAIFWILLLSVFACQERKQAMKDKPDAIRDLLIDRSFWQRKAGPQPQGSIVGTHRFTITNTSQRYVYQHIKIRFDYYDRGYHKIDSALHVIERTIEPRSAIKIDTVETKLNKEGAMTATATIVNASVD
ncbi:hypothetical protein [Spirosoma validum]|uniref:Uncharacterized protein n=1 Tax=Spirosoma validum TaxID=2771355 RepID=A0A927B661_9BACT|nr:hypothetical protein [Spirosoma validum]MBD2755956.1 hypothetical protein [Spirosoma validum]